MAQGAGTRSACPLGSGIAGAVAPDRRRSSTSPTPTPTRASTARSTLATGYRTRTILCVPMRDTRGRGDRRHPGAQQAATAPSPPRTRSCSLALGGQAAGGHRERHPPRGDPARSSRASSRPRWWPSSRATRPPPATPSRVADAHRRRSRRRVEHVAAGPLRRHCASAPSELQRDPLRGAAARLRQGRRARARAGQGEEALPARARAAAARASSSRARTAARELRPAARRGRAPRRGGRSPSRRGGGRARSAASSQQLDEIARVHPRLQPAHGARAGRLRAARRDLGGSTFTDARRRRAGRCSRAREVQALSIPRGSLSRGGARRSRATSPTPSASSRRSPGPATLRRVPEIAYAHHEKLDGNGYPRAVPAEQHPGAVADDDHLRHLRRAHRVSDRPYKKAVPHEKALDILERRRSAGSSTASCSRSSSRRRFPAKR